MPYTEIIPNNIIQAGDNIVAVTHTTNKLSADVQRIDYMQQKEHQMVLSMLVTTVSLMYDLDDIETYNLSARLMRDQYNVNVLDPLSLRQTLIQWVFELKEQRR